MPISWELGSIFVAVALEAGVLLRVFQRAASLYVPSLIIAPLLAVLALRAAPWVAAQAPTWFARGRVDFAAVFLIAVALEAPLSAYGYTLTPAATFLERLVVAGSFAVVSILTAKSLLNLG